MNREGIIFDGDSAVTDIHAASPLYDMTIKSHIKDG